VEAHAHSVFMNDCCPLVMRHGCLINDRKEHVLNKIGDIAGKDQLQKTSDDAEVCSLKEGFKNYER
jgi:hypothetical protein